MRTQPNPLVLFLDRHILPIVFTLNLFFIVGIGFMLQYARPVTFSYSGQSCVTDPTILPKLHKQSNPDYALQQQSTLKIKGYPLYAGKTCIEAKSAPKAMSSERVNLSTLGLPLIGKHYKVSSGELPAIDTAPLKEKISIKEQVVLTLSQPDEVFKYRLSVNDKSVFCDQKDSHLSCDIQKLALLQSQQYPLVIERYFGNAMVESVSKSSITTIEPITVTASSIASGAMLYDSPTEAVITTDKSLVSAKVDLLTKATQQAVAVTTTTTDKTIHIKFAKPLDRKLEYSLVVREAVAKDKAVLAKEYPLSFATSGGPKVIGTNIGRTSVDSGRAITVTLDQALAPGQDIAKLVSLSSGTTAIPYTPAVSGRQITITPKTPLSTCTTFTIKLTGGINNAYGISGDSAWSMNSRIKCYSVFSIGSSAQGRPIYAYRFGSGAGKVLYVGNIHGDEKSTKYLLDSWIQELDVYAERIPAGRQIIVVPSVNPDGFALSSRKNSRGVDLNRNFPTNDWKADVTMPGGQLAVGGGGGTALSEPESSAIGNLVLSERPSRVFTYHSVASIITANGIGDSGALASTYSRLSGYRVLPKSNTATVFNYDTTGAFEDWLYDKIGISTLLIELGSHSNSEFSKNKSAMWAML